MEHHFRQHRQSHSTRIEWRTQTAIRSQSHTTAAMEEGVVREKLKAFCLLVILNEDEVKTNVSKQGKVWEKALKVMDYRIVLQHLSRSTVTSLHPWGP